MDNSFEKLAERYDRGSVPIPKTDRLIVLLREIFTSEEAEFMGNWPPGAPITVEQIAEIVRRPVDEVRGVLEGLDAKGAVFSSEKDGIRRYMMWPLYPGVFEHIVMNPDKTERQRCMAHLIEDYYQRDLKTEIHDGSPWTRVITVEKEIPNPSEVYPYELVSEIIKMNKGAKGLGTCYCREEKVLNGKGCDNPRYDICLSFGALAEYLIQHRLVRSATTEEMLEALDRAEKAGLVHVASNTEKAPAFFCNCCSCCCWVLTGKTKLGRGGVLATSNFFVTFDTEKCTACGICEGRCPVKAVKIANGTKTLKQELCIGCGLCISTCPQHAIELRRRDDPNQVYKNSVVIDSIRMAERGIR